MKRLNFKRSEIDKLMIVINYVEINATLCAFLFRCGQSADRLDCCAHHETKDEDR